jgi:phage virion morphogenesis protein
LGIRVTGTVELERDLERVRERLADQQPLMEDIAQVLETETSTSFENEKSPFGKRWRPSKRVQKHGGRTLYDDKTQNSKRKHRTHLQDSIYSRATGSSAKIGTNRKYGKFHQLGTRKMVKREFLPIRDGKLPRGISEEISSIVSEYLFVE